MKIDGYNPGAIQGPPDRSGEVTRAGGGGAGSTTGATGADQVRFSGDVQLAQAATAAAARVPDVRQDVVDRMRALLDAGQIGNDPGQLADALINSWAETP